MSFKSRQAKRHIRKNQAKRRAADVRVAAFLRMSRPPLGRVARNARRSHQAGENG